jgi:hypothetical protein
MTWQLGGRSNLRSLDPGRPIRIGALFTWSAPFVFRQLSEPSVSHWFVGLLQAGPGRQRARLRGAMLMWVIDWMARWFLRSFAYPPGAKLTFPISFSAGQLWRGRGWRCVAEAPSSAGTGRTVSPAMAGPPRPWEEKRMLPPPVLLFSPHSVASPSNPSRRRFSPDPRRFRPRPQPPATSAPSEERAEWRPWR